MNSIKSFKGKFSLEEPKFISNLMIFPIIFKNFADDFQFKTLEEGIAKDKVVISEKARQAVEEIEIKNKYDTELFIIDGEGISGALQNRIVTSSFLIRPSHSTNIPVFCSEEGRWIGDKKFTHSTIIAYPSIRRINTSSYIRLHSSTYIQSSIWKEISSKQKNLNVISQTKSMEDIYTKKDLELERFEEYEPLINQAGFLAATQKRILCVDIFINNYLFGKFRLKLLISYALDAIEDEAQGAGKFNIEKCKDFFNSLITANQIHQEKSVDLGQKIHYDFKSNLNSGFGKALYFKNKIIHASFFPQ